MIWLGRKSVNILVVGVCGVGMAFPLCMRWGLPVMAADAVLCTDGLACDLQTDREGRTYPALRTQRRTAVETHPAQPSHQHRERAHQSLPQLHAAVLRPGLQEPRSLRSMARCTQQRGARSSRDDQADVGGVRPSRQHDLLTPSSKDLILAELIDISLGSPHSPIPE